MITYLSAAKTILDLDVTNDHGRLEDVLGEANSIITGTSQDLTSWGNNENNIPLNW